MYTAAGAGKTQKQTAAAAAAAGRWSTRKGFRQQD
jgi:hypothetical protein